MTPLLPSPFVDATEIAVDPIPFQPDEALFWAALTEIPIDDPPPVFLEDPSPAFLRALHRELAPYVEARGRG